ncbi:hypothetical protein PF005_g19434 [Phytophthora fragariae]|uniref:Uncharacterized protein n=1 Tax=Phytophthora fragariae TaxID=53985 RepID=A0A6A4A5D0_9STRA|nr:hypothetical protein PF003_g16504 [Phytophthora fragariae]KAE8899257.1 hypothetical protein PF003_g16506 [Phytophthora fragariae]KAE8946589.1 hypothetical protein PF009_g3777 [Phytophthora fragariae]KAE9010261.1 hypothetical protein PF011_g9896 [Phytophthora fragariae]KAE9066389.1 hypothetical protein PF007_g28494 [Phytophthora fragariae]
MISDMEDDDVDIVGPTSNLWLFKICLDLPTANGTIWT